MTVIGGRRAGLVFSQWRWVLIGVAAITAFILGIIGLGEKHLAPDDRIYGSLQLFRFSTPLTPPYPTDLEIARALYRASQGGVEIDLVVRGMCVLRPGVPGLSERIRIRSIVGRFLEHSRIYVFENGGEREVYLSSADWMGRSLDRRVELAVPVQDPALAETVDRRILGLLLRETAKSRELLPDGTYRRVGQPNRPTVDAQRLFLAKSHHN